MSRDELKVVVTVPSSIDLRTELTTREPRISLLWEPSLFPRMRHVADFDGEPGFERSARAQRELDRLIGQADALYGIPDESPLALRSALDRNPGIRWVHTMAAGGGNQVRRAALTAEQLERVAVTTSSGVHSHPLAEFAVFGLLAGLKGLPQLSQLRLDRSWPPRMPTRELSDLTVVLLGTGGIGHTVADRLQSFGARLIGVNRRGAATPGVEQVFGYRDLVTALDHADAVVSSLPATPATHHLLDGLALDRLRPGAIVVNVGRGSVIDEAALIERLTDGRIGFAALDVFETEPLPASSPLWSLDNVIVSPHSAALSDKEEHRIAELFADNAGRLLDGRPLRSRMNVDEFY